MEVMKHKFNWNVPGFRLIHHISYHEIHLNNMYSFRATQRKNKLQ